MKHTSYEKIMILIVFLQSVLVIFYGMYENPYPKIYEDILGMIAIFILCIMGFIREVTTYMKGKINE